MHCNAVYYILSDVSLILPIYVKEKAWFFCERGLGENPLFLKKGFPRESCFRVFKKGNKSMNISAEGCDNDGKKLYFHSGNSCI